MLKSGNLLNFESKRVMSSLSIRDDVELNSCWEWIKSSFYVFREHPVHFIILSIVAVLFGIIPLFGAFMAPIFLARFALLANRTESGETIQISSLFTGLFANITLVRLSFLYFSLYAIIFIGQHFADIYLKGMPHGIIVMLFIVPLLILQMAMWISPIICLENPDIRPASAMGLSIKAGLYNVSVLLLFALLIVGFTVLAILPVGLGLLVWVPVYYISSYYVYRSIVIRA